VALDTTASVTEGIREIFTTIVIAIVLVAFVVYLFLQNWRATLIPLLAVPVSLIGTFVFFPLFGFSVNTLSLFGLVLAIGLVVDDAIVVVEAVERHIEHGLDPRSASLKAMEEISGPLVGIALVLATVFVPTIFIPGITGRLYQQFAATIAISVLLSAFNALTLSPSLASLLLRPRSGAPSLLRRFFDWFNRVFDRSTAGYLRWSRVLIDKSAVAFLILIAAGIGAGFLSQRVPSGFLPVEDQGYLFMHLQLPSGASLERTEGAAKKVEQVLLHTPGVKYTTSVLGFSLLNQVNTTYTGFLFVTLDEWSAARAGKRNIRKSCSA
jgi:HAE1 family hydrophobic/amphiphilic exporter-1